MVSLLHVAVLISDFLLVLRHWTARGGERKLVLAMCSISKTQFLSSALEKTKEKVNRTFP